MGLLERYWPCLIDVDLASLALPSSVGAQVSSYVLQTFSAVPSAVFHVLYVFAQASSPKRKDVML